MLSYRHGYHAGNFADVHKHCLLIQVLRLLLHKPAPLAYYETHAGRGCYPLDGEQAQKNREHEQGIARIAACESPPAAVRDYLSLVAEAANGLPDIYPGSPLLAARLLRAQDRAVLMELHSSEAPALKQLFRDDPRIAVHHRDGYEGLNALLPPAQKRGLVLIDPSYEVKLEYRDLPSRLLKAHRRWANGTYMIWYPLLPAGGHMTLREGLRASGLRRILDTEMQIAVPGERGMYGCGALIVNPPWQLDESWRDTNAWLAGYLAQGASSASTGWLVPE